MFEMNWVCLFDNAGGGPQQPEHDPFKYGSFAVNAGNVVYLLTNEIQQRLKAQGEQGKLLGIPPILAFSSVVDATVSTPALVSNLFQQLPDAGHELSFLSAWEPVAM